MKHLLNNVRIFAGLDDEAIGIFLGRGLRMEVSAGAVIVVEGETNKSMCLIESGEVRIVKKFNTPEAVTLAVLGPGDFFGEMCLLDTLPRSATGQAVSRATVFSIPCAAFHHLYEKLPKQYSILLLNIARDLSRRLRLLDEVFAARD